MNTCKNCGYDVWRGADFCDDFCKAEAEGIEMCFTCERPLEGEYPCICPPPREVTTVKVKAGLL